MFSQILIISKDVDSTVSPGNLFQHLTTLTVKKLSMFRQNLDETPRGESRHTADKNEPKWI